MADEFRIDEPIGPKAVEVTPNALVGKTQRLGYLADGCFFVAADDAEDLVTSSLHVGRVRLIALISQQKG
jgi:hypothetical protein